MKAKCARPNLPSFFYVSLAHTYACTHVCGLNFNLFPLLACMQDLYRHLIDDFLIERGQKLRKKDFAVVTDFMMRLKMGKRIHLCEYEADSLDDGLNGLFNRQVEIPRIRHGKRQTLDTLINEEALLLAKFLRNERKEWNPRIANIN